MSVYKPGGSRAVANRQHSRVSKVGRCGTEGLLDIDAEVMIIARV